MDKIKNWLLPVLVMLAAFFTEYFSLIEQLVTPKYVIGLKLLVGIIGIVIMKLQPPSLKHHNASK